MEVRHHDGGSDLNWNLRRNRRQNDGLTTITYVVVDPDVSESTVAREARQTYEFWNRIMIREMRYELQS